MSDPVNKRKVGSHYEERAAEFLENQGYEILERNYRNRGGEIDIIARDGDYLAFVEVKYRRDKGRGGALAAVHLPKQQRISKAALLYRMQKKIPEDAPCRFDVVGIEGGKITLVKNAFEFCYGRPF